MPDPNCLKCSDSGVVESGNNDFPCDCHAGDTAVFNDSFYGCVTGAVLKRRWQGHTLVPTSRDVPKSSDCLPRWPKLNRGTLVASLLPLDPDGANVPPGMLGVVFEEAEHHAPNTGPMVRWMNGGACNVYNGWISVVR